MKQATFIALASLLTTACGTDTEITKESEQNHDEVKIQLESLKIKTESVAKVGFTEVEVSE
jgi:hypothetical protein